MPTTTLRGIFPEPKPVYRRNFIKENVKSIKQMQGILQEAGVIQPRKPQSFEKYKNTSRLLKSRDSCSRSNPNLTKTDKRLVKTDKCCTKTSINTSTQAKLVKSKLTKKVEPRIEYREEEEESKFTNRAMQTERDEDLSHLYDTGVIKYPSPGVLKPKKMEQQSPKKAQSGQGDQIDNVTEDFENLCTEDKDFIKENKQNIKIRPTKEIHTKVPAQAPPTYQRGVVPKYLKDRKEDVTEEQEPECPPGHILLPEEERKETLRVLRQSYADRIQELNMMPVRNDTLKMRKRKMDIEEELKRIDGGIKVFQRPKVFVKINA